MQGCFEQVLEFPDWIFTPLFKGRCLQYRFFPRSHVECSEVQGFLSSEDSTPLSRAASVVIQEILSMYSDILAFLHSVVQLNTIFCFNLLRDQEALDRIMQLYSLHAPSASKLHTVTIYVHFQTFSTSSSSSSFMYLCT